MNLDLLTDMNSPPESGFRNVTFCRRNLNDFASGAELKFDVSSKSEVPVDVYMKIPDDRQNITAEGEHILALISHEQAEHGETGVMTLENDNPALPPLSPFPKRLTFTRETIENTIEIPVNEETTLNDCLSLLKNRGEHGEIVELIHSNMVEGADVPIYQTGAEGELGNPAKTFEHFSDIGDGDKILMCFAEEPLWPKTITFMAGDKSFKFPILRDNTVAHAVEMLKQVGDSREIDRIAVVEEPGCVIYSRAEIESGRSTFGQIFVGVERDVRLQVYFEDRYGEWPIQVKFNISRVNREISMELNENDTFQEVMDQLKAKGVNRRILLLTHSAEGNVLVSRDASGNLVGADKLVSEDLQVHQGDEIEVEVEDDSSQWPHYFEFRVEAKRTLTLPLCGEHSIGDVLHLLHSCGVEEEVVKLYHPGSNRDLFCLPEAGSLNEEDAERLRRRTVAELFRDLREGNAMESVIDVALGRGVQGACAGWQESSSSPEDACGEGACGGRDVATEKLHFKIKNKRTFVDYDENYTLEAIMRMLQINYEDSEISDIRVKSKSLFKKIKGISAGDIWQTTLADFKLQPGDYIELIYGNREDAEPFHAIVEDSKRSPVFLGLEKTFLIKNEAFTNYDLKKKMTQHDKSARLDQCHLFEYHCLDIYPDTSGFTDRVCFFKPLYDQDQPPLHRCSDEKENLLLLKDCEFVNLKERRVVGDWESKWPWGNESYYYWLFGVKMTDQKNEKNSFLFVKLMDENYIEVDRGEVFEKNTNFDSDKTLDRFVPLRRRRVTLFIAFMKKEDDVHIFIPNNKSILRIHCRLTEENIDNYVVKETERFNKLKHFACSEGFWMSCRLKTARKVTNRCRKADQDRKDA